MARQATKTENPALEQVEMAHDFLIEKETQVKEASQLPEQYAYPSLDQFKAAFQELVTLKERVARLEGMAHTEHALGSDAVNHIAGVTIAKMNEQLGLSGMPSRGDQS